MPHHVIDAKGESGRSGVQDVIVNRQIVLRREIVRSGFGSRLKVRPFRKQEQLRFASDAADVREHSRQDVAVHFPLPVEEDEVVELHGPADAGDELQLVFQDDFELGERLKRHQRRPEEHPIQTSSVVHDEEGRFSGDDRVAEDFRLLDIFNGNVIVGRF